MSALLRGGGTTARELAEGHLDAAERENHALNAWLSIVLFVASVAFFVWWQIIRPWRGRRGGRERKRPDRPRRRGPAMAIPRKRVRPSR